MDKDNFLKELKYQLRYLTKEALEEELKNNQDYNSPPEDIANNIYQKRGLNIKVARKSSFLDSVATIIEAFKDKKNISNLLGFFLYVFLLIILIKIPFSLIRDMISTIFNVFFSNEIISTIWDLTFELLYAITAILIFIKFIKNKAQEYEKADVNVNIKT